MKAYLDTGILLKLYTAEPESLWVEKQVRRHREPIRITDLHLAECVAALRLKVFRKECEDEEASRALDLLKEDIRQGILQVLELDWERTWQECRLLSDQYAAEFGTRTLGTLHVACARLLEAQNFLTTDSRQARLARRVGLRVHSPTR